MAFTKITNTELNSRGATTLPNQPTISAAALKQEFDAPAKEIVAPHFNGLIDELEADTAGASIGLQAPSRRTGSTVKAVVDAISQDLVAVEGKLNGVTNAQLLDAVYLKHGHENKALLDTYDQTNEDIEDAVNRKHSHSNKLVLDKLSESAGGAPLYNGQPMSGDMYSSEYDPDSTVKNAGGIESYVTTGLGTKVDKVEGKGLSTNDFTDALKTKLDNIEAGAEVNVQSDWDQSDNSADDYIKNKPSLGTSAYKNSTSVVTQSSDLVESGAVYDVIQGQEQLLENTVGWTGKNLLDNILTSQTVSNVVLTVNADKSITANTPTDPASANVSKIIGYIYSTDVGNKSNLWLSGCPSGGSSTKYAIWAGIRNASDTGWVHTGERDTGDGLLIDVQNVDYSYVQISIEVKSGQSVNNLVFKPMVRRIDIIDPTYEPYHASVEESKADNSVIGTVEGANASKAWSAGEHFIKNGQFKEVTQAIVSGGAINDSNTVDKPIADCLLSLLPIFNNAGSHNGIFRGKNLGSSLTAAQKTAIANGSFEDLYIGDYWEINSIKWRIAHFDYWLNCGDTQCTTHHVVVVPDSALVDKMMNAKVDNANTTAGAYVNSEMRTTNLADAKTIVNAAFGADNILGYREYMQNAVTDGYESAAAWVNADIELMSEIMVYGSNIFHNIKNGTALPNNYTINKTQFALFGLDSSYIIGNNVAQTGRTNWWLRDVVSATNFANVNTNGLASASGASSSYGVRPAFGIK